MLTLLNIPIPVEVESLSNATNSFDNLERDHQQQQLGSLSSSPRLNNRSAARSGESLADAHCNDSSIQKKKHDSSFHYYTGLDIDYSVFKVMSNSPKSGSKSPKHILRKSPSNDSGNHSGPSIVSDEDRFSPLRRRHLSCLSNSSSGSSISGPTMEDKGNKKGKPKGSSSSLRLLKAMTRPSLTNITTSLGKSSGKKVKQLDPHLGITGVGTTAEESTCLPNTASSSSSRSSLRVLRDSFRAVRKLIPSTKPTKGKQDDHKGSNSSNGSAASAPSSPKLEKQVGHQKSASVSNLSSWRGVEEARKLSSLSEAEHRRRKAQGLEKVGALKKTSILQNVRRIVRGKSKDYYGRRTDETIVEAIATKKSISVADLRASEINCKPSATSRSTSLSSQSQSQEILRLDSEPKIRTPKTFRKSKRSSTMEEKDRKVTDSVLDKGENIPEAPATSVSPTKKKSKEKKKKQEGKGVQKKSWSGVVFNESNAERNPSPDVVFPSNQVSGAVLETTLDQDETNFHEIGKEVQANADVRSSESEANNPNLIDVIEQEVKKELAPTDSSGEVHPALQYEASFVDLDSDVTVAEGVRVVESHGDADEQKAVQATDEEPSCTKSFMELKPFDFDSTNLAQGKRERLYKVLVVGELGSGKTSIIKRYVHQFFSQHYRATIGVDFALKVLRWDGDTVVRLQLWDIAGQERFGSMTRVYYREAVGAFVVFDVTRSATLEAVPKWKADLDSKVALPDGRPIPTVLLANKSDQPKEGIAANREKMNEFCQQQGFSAWFETSAKDNINIDEASNFLVSKILEMDRWSQEPANTDPDKVELSANGKHNVNSSNNCAC